ncbi:uncharacterized protein SAPINGB_P004289 [Magnusiomyces paraingens]|uniref:Reverse transcriptase Ty1/copia-type domain-containing protein n=1 Tax=Magnusiomyces paraingens TaxID=2606893 RepID=A0A5E8BUP1_9ASCO|nr:uncharacterized protein SAPINGB_P004289 [Saprochaete ingens]VVT54841.1 unnamed protein product [Saprochaete ingens]
MEAAKHTLRYLKGTAELGLEYRAQKVYKLVGYSDADYAQDKQDRKSFTGDVLHGSEPSVHRRTKHIDVRYHVVRHYIRSGVIHLEYLDTQVMLADMFTKNLGRVKFET